MKIAARLTSSRVFTLQTVIEHPLESEQALSMACECLTDSKCRAVACHLSSEFCA